MIDSDDNSELKKLQYKRRTLKGQLTRFKNSLGAIALEPEPDLIQLEFRLAKLEPLLDNFNEVQSEIEMLDSGTPDEVNELARQEFEDFYFKISSEAKALICNNSRGPPPAANAQSESSESNQSNSHNTNIKLPPITLPTFDGNYEQWLFFRDTFESLIHKDESIPIINKFHYLRLSLKGQAAQLLTSLECSASNYQVAWDLLVKRYENKQVLIKNHIKAIFELEPIAKESLLSLRGLLDGMTRHLRALEVLGQPVNYWDSLIIHLFSLKLDSFTRREWETEYSKQDNTTLKKFTDFLYEKCKVLESIQSSQTLKNKNVSSGVRGLSASAHAPICFYCSKEHTIYNCKEFLNLNVQSRISEAKKLKLCSNCLRNNHTVDTCRSIPCRKCQKKHNTLLHIDFSANNANTNPNWSKNKDNVASNVPNKVNCNISNANENAVQIPHTQDSTTNSHFSSNYSSGSVLLSTVLIYIYDNKGSIHMCRALLDNGSESTFITENLCKKLNVPLQSTNLSITGIGHTYTKALKLSNVTIESRQTDFKMNLKCLVLSKITNKIPTLFVDISQLNIPSNLILADPSFNEPGPIDILIGADYFWDLLSVGQIKLGSNLPTMQKTQFGWVISGKFIPKGHISESISCNFSALEIEESLENQLLKFWELEEVSPPPTFSSDSDEVICEELFVSSTVRQTDGRFIVDLPLKHSPSVLGNSLENATKRFLSLERKLNRNPQLKAEYSKFLREYETLKHMTKLDYINTEQLHYYLPHHCVIKEDSTTTKLRVVFDASAKTSSNISLNDILRIGPTIQEDLFSIVLRARKHNILLTADIAKMYRQVLINVDQRPLQLILWRSDPNSKIETFQLNTLTYGTAPASFLSTRCIKELSIECQNIDPEISQIIARDFYVDDLCTGGNSVDEVIHIKNRISEILLSGGFELRKFSSNNFDVVSNVNVEDNSIVSFGELHEYKTLGLIWEPSCDVLKYFIRPTAETSCTKRCILSAIAQIFDPLGLLAPVIIIAKMLMQRLWQSKISWDESVPLDIHSTWIRFKANLDDINSIKIPRHAICKNPIKIEMHGFSDASEVAYGACIYIRSFDSFGNYHVHLLCAKSRIAPIKTITIARLELCAALLLAQLSETVKKSLDLQVDTIFYWCDSKIVLAWINSSSQQWKIFVANRVSQIQSLTNPDSWFYVKTQENPADIVSRGLNPSLLLNNKLWWHGPTWLFRSQDDWPLQSNNPVQNLDNNPEKRSIKPISFVVTPSMNLFDLFERFSTFTKLQRVTAYCLRFLYNTKMPMASRSHGPLKAEELLEALKTLIRLVQQDAFSKEFNDLKRGRHVDTKSKLLNLNPFIDNEKIIRVGGRIKHSNFDFEKKFPAVLPDKHIFSKLLVRYEHVRLLHAGPQLLLASLRDRFWHISGRNLVRKMVRECVTCSRFNPITSQYLMGDLPDYRVTPSRPFLNVGVDFCGYFLIKDRQTRNYKKLKAYVCLFVCLTTRAVHLELVTSLSTDAFLAALRRFFARRGVSANIYSDHGTNFVGAKAEIEKFVHLNKNEIQNDLSLVNVKWHFIPPKSPHFGGIWEAGVKSTKFHLKRVLTNAVLNFEDFMTVLCQVEACLNSRPLSPLTSNPSDLQPLTPAHFLIGERLTSLPDKHYVSINSNRLSIFQRLQSITQHFWQRWSKEFISELQTRSKWKKNYQNLLQPGVMVLVKEDNLPPLKWQLGRVEAIHPGKDGIVRTATVRTSTSTLKRPAVKLCILPNPSDEDIINI